MVCGIDYVHKHNTFIAVDFAIQHVYDGASYLESKKEIVIARLQGRKTLCTDCWSTNREAELFKEVK